MISVNFLVVSIIVYTYSYIPVLSIGQYTNTTRAKREISTITDKYFKKERISSAAFTKVGSTRLDYETWPKLVIFIIFIEQIKSYC